MMELVWDDHPIPDGPFFTRDLCDKYSLAPRVSELWNFLNSPRASENPSSSPKKETAVLKGKRSSRQVSHRDSDGPWEDMDAGGAEDSKDGTKSSAKHEQNEAGDAFPEPRLPFPCLSSLSSTDHYTYIQYLKDKNGKSPPQSLTRRLNNEVMQFMKYLQDVSKMCADDYNFISQGAMQYSEEFFRACLQYIKTFPQFYTITEITSLTGGTFNPALTLTFEKQLLIMGSVSITQHRIVPADAQLALDYQTVSSENPPAKKAKDTHAMVSSDGNAEKLCALYEPQVCLTRDALCRLLDNHGPDFAEQWELPVSVKATPGKGSSQKKTVYIDSPLLKTEMTVRERSHIFHQESLKLSVVKKGNKNVFHLMTEGPAHEEQVSPEEHKRSCASLENTGLDFEVDLTDLETFGETITKRSTRKGKQKEADGTVQSKKLPSPPVLGRANRSSEHLDETNMSSSAQDTIDGSLAKNDDLKNEPVLLVMSDGILPKKDPVGQSSSQGSDDEHSFTGDSEDDKLAIDESVSPKTAPAKQAEPRSAACLADSSVTPAPEASPVSTEFSPPHKGTRSRTQSKRGKVSGDQLGEILRMQTAMFKSAGDKAAIKSPGRSVEPSVHSHPTSLVKPCVTSYLERQQKEDSETCAAPHESASVKNVTEHKKILSQVLQACDEDEQDYESPAEGNVLYKLYSLQDLLLMVRSSVSLTHGWHVGSSRNQFVPVHVLPKLEYQLTYGVECLTSSEACQLWTETLLHPTTLSYVAHINAHTSKVALLRKLPDDWKENISGGFKPSKSLNILHHILKKLTGLEEGEYLITHKAWEPFVTLLKSAKGKASRSAYDLQQIHSSVPQPPASGHVPWIPVDPHVLLPFHLKHTRLPCTFPPKIFPKRAQKRAGNYGGGQKSSPKAKGNKKGKKKRPATRSSGDQL